MIVTFFLHVEFIKLHSATAPTVSMYIVALHTPHTPAGMLDRHEVTQHRNRYEPEVSGAPGNEPSDVNKKDTVKRHRSEPDPNIPGVNQPISISVVYTERERTRKRMFSLIFVAALCFNNTIKCAVVDSNVYVVVPECPLLSLPGLPSNGRQAHIGLVTGTRLFHLSHNVLQMAAPRAAI